MSQPMPADGSPSVDLNEVQQQAKKLCRADTTLCQQFVDAYYRNLTSNSDALTAVDLAGMAVHHFDLLKRYDRKLPSVAVFNPNMETHQFHSSHSVIQMVAFDRPFLVDTVLMSLEKANINVYRLLHTIVDVTWQPEADSAGSIQSIQPATDSGTRYVSLIHCEIDRQQSDELGAIDDLMLDKIQVLDTIAGDWGDMQQRMTQVISDLDNAPNSGATGSAYDVAEVKAFLNWISDDNFIFLGYREYRLEQDKHTIDLMTVGGSGLGILGGIHEDARSESFAGLPDALKHLVTKPQVLLLSKSSHESPVHRPAYMDFLGIQIFSDDHRVIGEHRFVGLFTSQAYQLDAQNIPLLRNKTQKILQRADLPKGGHGYQKLRHIINSLPRDDLFQGQIDELYHTIMGIANLQNRKRLRLFTRVDRYERFVSCLVYIPREKFKTKLRVALQQALTAAYNGQSSGFSTEFDESNHARVHVHVRTTPGQIPEVDTQELEQQLTKLMQNWQDDVEHELNQQLGEASANALMAKFSEHVPAAYQEQFNARTAVLDLQRLSDIDAQDDATDDNGKKSLRWHLYHRAGSDANQLNLKVYGKDEPATLSTVLPILEKFGVAVMSAQTYEFDGLGLWMQEYELQLKHVDHIDIAVVRKQFEHALDLIWHGEVESDYFNELVLTTDLDTHDVVILRALSRYLKQTGLAFSRRYVEDTVVKNAAIATELVALFDARMHPKYGEHDSDQRQRQVLDIQSSLTEALAGVTSLDEDRILNGYMDVINAMSRTNFYQRGPKGNRKDRLSFKFLAQDIKNLPKPKPMFEIFVYSPRVEAVHLRGGRVARGGLRWSDRMEDFRTEVLGLVKAQMVKNAVIVPVGSKGGFVVKQKSRADGREAFLQEGIACYQTFLRGMLDVTDNLQSGQVTHPKDTVRHDGDDPYLVVAADKGTATFSDIANDVAAEYDFWLDDAFASGGSVGYDHKAMGITARGAWESVKRHFRMLGKDIQNHDDFSVMGIGDMGGDVFGNGMLLSEHIKLVGAFNHLHIFVDPAPDMAASFAERQRLFDEQGGWDKYNTELISTGGGVFSRSDKSITISQQMQQVLGIDDDIDALTPDELIVAMLKAPVDLLWNGGIGTYVKASSETHADVGDRANDSLRVNGDELGARVFGEGGNLGATQLGRIEYAQAGGHVYTDAIDNSGGVNCSDHEVNIKILLGDVVKNGDMTLKQRNELLAAMTDTVADLVLRQNYLQPQTIELSRLYAADNLREHTRFIEFLSKQDRLNRDIEFLPNDEVIATRRKANQGLTRSELAVVLAYGKMWVYDSLLDSSLPDESYFIDELKKYFPDQLAANYFEQMQSHRLNREIISTYLTNSVVNRLGLEALFRLYEDTKQPLDVIIRAYAVVRDVYNIRKLWDVLESLDNQVDAKLLLQLEHNIRSLLERSIIWLIDAFGAKLDVAKMSQTFGQQVEGLITEDGVISTHFAAALNQKIDALRSEYDIDDATAKQLMVFYRLPYYIDALDIALLADDTRHDVAAVARVYFNAYEMLHITWFVTHIEQIAINTLWDRRAKHALINELGRLLRQLMQTVLRDDEPASALRQWQDDQSDELDRIKQQIDELPVDEVNLAALSVLVSELTRIVK